MQPFVVQASVVRNTGNAVDIFNKGSKDVIMGALENASDSKVDAVLTQRENTPFTTLSNAVPNRRAQKQWQGITR